jgi:hypothetical protein
MGPRPGRLRISFDVDGTLTGIPAMAAEPPLARWRRRFHPEPLRLGTVALMAELIRHDAEIWIYTTSYRAPRYLRGWLRAHGIPLAGAVDQDRHGRIVGRQGPSKLPPAFGIDIHVDDSEGVARGGQRHGFKVVVVRPDALDRTARVLEAVGAR